MFSVVVAYSQLFLVMLVHRLISTMSKPAKLLIGKICSCCLVALSVVAWQTACASDSASVSIPATKKTLIAVDGLEQWRCGLIDSLDGLKQTAPPAYALIINGGYFDRHHKPVGYFKRDGEVLNDKREKKFSGAVLIDAQGKIGISDQQAAFDEWPTIIQCGPLLIDRGGKMGIYRNINQRYDRMVLIKLNNGNVSLLFHPKIDLFVLAELILKRYPDVDLALNLDGGPSCCVMSDSHAIRPGKALPYYLRFDKVE